MQLTATPVLGAPDLMQTPVLRLGTPTPHPLPPSSTALYTPSLSPAALLGWGRMSSSGGQSLRTLSADSSGWGAAGPTSVSHPLHCLPLWGLSCWAAPGAISPLSQVQATGRELFQQVCDKTSIREVHFFGLSVVRSKYAPPLDPSPGSSASSGGAESEGLTPALLAPVSRVCSELHVASSQIPSILYPVVTHPCYLSRIGQQAALHAALSWNPQLTRPVV